LGSAAETRRVAEAGEIGARQVASESERRRQRRLQLGRREVQQPRSSMLSKGRADTLRRGGRRRRNEFLGSLFQQQPPARCNRQGKRHSIRPKKGAQKLPQRFSIAKRGLEAIHPQLSP